MKPIELDDKNAWEKYCAFREKVWTYPNGKRGALDEMMKAGGYKDRLQTLVKDIINPMLVEIQRDDFHPLLRKEEFNLTADQPAKQLKESICKVLVERRKQLAGRITDEEEEGDWRNSDEWRESRESQEFHTKIYAALNKAVEHHLYSNPVISESLPDLPNWRIFTIYLGYEVLIACLYGLGSINPEADLNINPETNFRFPSIAENLWKSQKKNKGTSGANESSSQKASGSVEDDQGRSTLRFGPFALSLSKGGWPEPAGFPFMFRQAQHERKPSIKQPWEDDPQWSDLAKLRQAIVALDKHDSDCAKRVWIALRIKNYFLSRNTGEPVSGKDDNKARLMEILREGKEFFDDDHPYCVAVEDFDRSSSPLAKPLTPGKLPNDPARREERRCSAYYQYGQDFLEILRTCMGGEPDRYVYAFLLLPLRNSDDRHLKADEPRRKPRRNSDDRSRNANPDALLNRPTFDQMKSARDLLYRARIRVLLDIVQKFGL